MITSYFVIKPDAFEQRDQIKTLIKNNWFEIVSSKVMEATSNMVTQIFYKYDEEWLQECHKHFFCWKPIEVGVISGNTLEDFVSFTWRDADPNKCPENSIRGIFWSAAVCILQYKYYVNAIHRPVNQKELLWCIGSICKLSSV